MARMGAQIGLPLIGGALGLVALILLLLWLLRRRRRRVGADAPVAGRTELSKETVSITSSSRSISRDRLLYGSGAARPPRQPSIPEDAPAPPYAAPPTQPAAPDDASVPLIRRKFSCSDVGLQSLGVSMDPSSADAPGGGGGPTSERLRRKFSEQPPQSHRYPSAEAMDSAADFLQRRRSSTQPIGAIQPDLYRRKGSIITQSTISGSTVGRVRLKLNYDFAKSDFVVGLLEVADLPPNISEFYFKVQLNPDVDDKKRRESTRQRRSAKGLLAEEHFKFAVTYAELMERSLDLQLLDSGRIGRVAAVVGAVVLQLKTLDPSADLEVWADIEPHAAADEFGELLCSLHYLPSVERLTVTVHQAKNLLKMDITGGSDPYVKVTLVQDGKTTKKRKTAVKKNTLSPVWNEAHSFSLSESALKKCHIELLIMDRDMISNDDVMGFIMIGGESEDVRAQHLWNDVLGGRPGRATWLKLLPCPADKRRNSS